MPLAKELIESGILKLRRCPKCGKLKFPKLGEVVIKQGDARRLSELLSQVGFEPTTIVTSPPYSNSYLGGGDSERRIERLVKAGHDPKDFLGGKARNAVLKHYNEVDAIVTSPPYADIRKHDHRAEKPEALAKMADKLSVKSGDHHTPGRTRRIKSDYEGYSENLGNIGNLPYVDAIVTSPPYTNQAAENLNVSKYRKGGKFAEEKLVDAIVTSPPYSESMSKKRKGYTVIPQLATTRHIGEDTKDENIANLPHGNVDTIITSPPYAEANRGGGIAQKGYEGKYGHDEKLHLRHDRPLSDNPDNISNLTYVDTVITSPPYDHQLHDSHEKRATWKGGGRDKEKNLPVGYSENPENIGNLKSIDKEYEALAESHLTYVDTVITSPPYAHESTASKPTKLEVEGKFNMGHSKETPYTGEDYRKWDKREGANIGKRKLFIRVPCSPEEAQFHDIRPGRKGTIWEWTKEVEATLEAVEKIHKLKDVKKGRSETYLEAMYKVYKEMFKVLKHGGRAIIVVKPFIRNMKVVDLPFHSYLLLSKVGFSLEKLYKLRLKQQSFWRILYYRRFPSAPKIAHEYILVCKKG